MKEVLLLKAVCVISHGWIPGCLLHNKCRWLFKRNVVALSGVFSFVVLGQREHVCACEYVCRERRAKPVDQISLGF